MKTIFFFVVLCIAQNAFSVNITLKQALLSPDISYKIRGNSASTHYLEPVILELTNKSSQAYTISVETGDMFIPSDTSYQNIVITANEILALRPNSKQSFPIKGMCTESGDKGGSDNTLYAFRTSGNEQLKKLSGFINDKKYQTSAAQSAVWALMNNSSLYNIFAADTAEEGNLLRFMAKLTRKPLPIKDPNNYHHNYYTPPVEYQTVSGKLEYSFSRPKDIQIVMFNTNGILVRELVNKRQQAPGEYVETYQFDSTVYPDDVYYIKLIADNRVMMTHKWDKKNW